MILKVLTIIVLSLTQVVTVFPQQPAQTPPAQPAQDEPIRLATSSVQLDVIVTDKTGRRINGLTAADFEVTDEGQPQKIDFFYAFEGSKGRTELAATATQGGAAAARAQASPLAMPFQGRFIALLFDTYNISPENFNRARKSLVDYINTQVSPEDMVSITSTGGYLGALQQFTTDKQRLLAALNRIAAQTGAVEKNSARLNLTPAEAARIDQGDQQMLDTVVTRLAQDESTFAGMTKEMIENQVRIESRTLLSLSSQTTRNTLATLDSLFKSMAELPGRKIAVLMTEQLYTSGGTDYDVSSQVNRVIDRARRSGISIYALDAGGLRAGNTQASERSSIAAINQRNRDASTAYTDFQNLGGAHALALATGGEVIANTNSLGTGLQRAVEDSSTYYVVGFTPAATPDNKFHRLVVTVKGKPDLIVRSRKGYLALNEETARGTGTEMLAAIISPVQRTDLRLDIVANVVPEKGEQTILTGLHVGRRYLSLPAATAPQQTSAYDIMMVVFASGKDQPVGEVRTTVNYDFTKDPDARQKLKTDGFTYVKTFTQLEPGSYQVRAVVRERATGMLGSAYQFFEVPDLKNKKYPALSSLILQTPGQPGFDGSNNFKPGEEMEIRYVLYNPPKSLQGYTQQVKLIDSNSGKVLFDSPLGIGPAQAADPTAAPQGTKFKLPPMRGRYALVVTLQGDKGKVDLERRADFVIE